MFVLLMIVHDQLPVSGHTLNASQTQSDLRRINIKGLDWYSFQSQNNNGDSRIRGSVPFNSSKNPLTTNLFEFTFAFYYDIYKADAPRLLVLASHKCLATPVIEILRVTAMLPNIYYAVTSEPLEIPSESLASTIQFKSETGGPVGFSEIQGKFGDKGETMLKLLKTLTMALAKTSTRDSSRC